MSRRKLLTGAVVTASAAAPISAQAAQNPPYLTASSPNYPSAVDTGHGMVIFGRGPGRKLFHKWQDFAGAAWSSWVAVPIGERVLASDPAAVANAHGGLSVFARSSTGELLHAWQDHQNGVWSAGTNGGPITGNPAVVVNPHGGMSVFFQSANGRTTMIRQNKEHELPGRGWTGWQDLGAGATGQPMPVIGATGGVALFARGTNGQVLYKWQKYLGGPWSPSQTTWHNLGGNLTADPVAVLCPNGGLSLFGRNGQGVLSHAWQKEPGGEWDLRWITMTDIPILGRPSVLVDPSGGMHVFAWGTHGGFLHWWQEGFSGVWHGPADLIGTVNAQPSAVLNPSGKISVFGRTPAGRVLHKWQQTASPGSAWNEVLWPDELN